MAIELSDEQQLEFRVGLARLRENFLNNAEMVLDRLLKQVPEHHKVKQHLGVTLFKLGRHDEGVAMIKAAIEAAPDEADAWWDLAAAHHRLGQSEAAGQAYARAMGGPADPPKMIAFTAERWTHEFTIVDYPYKARIRYGAGLPPHPQLAALIGEGRDRYAKVLAGIGEIQADFAQVPIGGTYEEVDPFWLNSWFPPLDGMALTQMLRANNPKRFVEIGSGVSTKFARRAVRLYGLRTKLASIDPQPRNEIDKLCDQVVRKPLEDVGLRMFEALEAGDILFLDSSHRSFQNSDVTVFFLDILPRLKPGVIVQVHDVYLPDDYISGHLHRLWNEQYMLATALLYGGDKFEILFPSWFVSQDPQLLAQANGLMQRGALAELNLYGASFWMRIR